MTSNVELGEIIEAEEHMMINSNTSNQTSIDIGDVKVIASGIQRKLFHKPPASSQCSIFRVPNKLRKHMEKVFVPVVVSIGPFHRPGNKRLEAMEKTKLIGPFDHPGNKRLEAMEKTKLWYLHGLLSRAPTERTTLEYFVQEIGSMEQHCRESYAEEIHLSKEEFIEMMVVDGCFIIEFLRKYLKMGPVPDKEDPVFNMSWMPWQIGVDLLLLENQLPWCVLDCLFNSTKSKKVDHRSVLDLIVNWLSKSRGTSLGNVPGDTENKHLLDCYRNRLAGSYQAHHVSSAKWDLIPSATELQQAGIRFEVGDKRKKLDVTFKSGVMKIPSISIQEYTESDFRNIIAYEQCDLRRDLKVTSYVVLLDNLINTSKDVDLLRRQKILQISQSNEDVANYLNRLYQDVYIDDFLYKDLYVDVNKYYEQTWNRWRTILKRDYFNTPWMAMSVIAAIFILSFTFLQTFYSVISYYKK
ncbi:hypothetical protein CJ030_MR5G004110 [Morella rubra]|uniref:Uncharacterized protein n=1 Tax=Morella rubra TaxID=262757 RepID=A0A6A1VMB7_9ROSI|nr:hypothetical protein CJ030_MR5G004110 [Morella rubra]